MALLERPERPWGLVLQHLKYKGKTLLGCSVERQFRNTLEYTKYCSGGSRGAADSPGFSLTHPASCSDLLLIIPPSTCPHLPFSPGTELEFKQEEENAFPSQQKSDVKKIFPIFLKAKWVLGCLVQSHTDGGGGGMRGCGCGS